MRCKFCSFEPQPKKIPDEMVSELRQHVWWQHAEEWGRIDRYLRKGSEERLGLMDDHSVLRVVKRMMSQGQKFYED